MSWGMVAIGAATVISSVIQANSAKKAGDTQADAARAGISEQQRQFDEIRKLLEPYVTSGTGALGGLAPYAEAGKPALEQQQALLGLKGEAAQKAAIAAIEGGGVFQGLVAQGENAMLQNASATGGLRGGNIQAALAQFRPQMLSQAINDQYSRLGGMTALGQQTTQNIAQMGQAAAAGQASAGMQTSENIANLLGQAGAAKAASQLAQGQIYGKMVGNLAGMAGSYFGGA